MAEERLTYSHRPRPVGFAATLTLDGDTLSVEQGGRARRIPLGQILDMRLWYRPANSTLRGYACRLITADRRTVTFGNVSWKSLVEIERQDGAYRRFTEALARRIAAANPALVLRAGLPRPMFALALLLAAAATLLLTGIAVREAMAGIPGMAALAAGTALLFGGLNAVYLARNHPHRVTPDTLPASVLPRPDAP